MCCYHHQFMKLPQGSRHVTKHTNCTVAASGSLNGKEQNVEIGYYFLSYLLFPSLLFSFLFLFCL